MKFKNILFYLSSVLISTFNGFSLISILKYQVSKNDLLEYFGRAILFGYLLTAIVFAGMFVSFSLATSLDSEIKGKDARLTLHSSVIAFCIIILLYFFLSF